MLRFIQEPPEQEKTQLDIPFPDEMIGDIDIEKYEGVLTAEQLAKLKIYEGEMNELLGVNVYNRLKNESIFQ